MDFKASFGAGDKSLIEFKLGSNTQLKRNLQKQVAIYEAANRTRHVGQGDRLLHRARTSSGSRGSSEELKLENEESIVLIDARSDNKPSASKA